MITLFNSDDEAVVVEESEMPMAAAIAEFLTINDWNDQIKQIEAGESARLVYTMTLEGLDIKFFVESFESRSEIRIYGYSPFSVPPKKMAEVSRLLNMINMQWDTGRFSCYDDDDSNSIQYRHNQIYLDECSGQMVDKLTDIARYAWENFGEIISSVVFTKISAKDAWAEYRKSRQKKQNESDNEDDEGAPSEL